MKVPAGAAAGTGTLVLTAAESGTVVKTAVLVGASVPVPPKCTAPVKRKRPAESWAGSGYGKGNGRLYRPLPQGLDPALHQ